ncbi:hypothetical protein B0I29_109205 [Actinoplanes lutulentus]|uniref:Uncharacterized protein n=1 Tax=Actinoplanes lutulentus TaxID=1287878 RepID=A0A327ZI36_9ACTN|nr:hypothetical protein B0I29_109205 [Actinoplanes lutulentus]
MVRPRPGRRRRRASRLTAAVPLLERPRRIRELRRTAGRCLDHDGSKASPAGPRPQLPKPTKSAPHPLSRPNHPPKPPKRRGMPTPRQLRNPRPHQPTTPRPAPSRPRQNRNKNRNRIRNRQPPQNQPARSRTTPAQPATKGGAPPAPGRPPPWQARHGYAPDRRQPSRPSRPIPPNPQLPHPRLPRSKKLPHPRCPRSKNPQRHQPAHRHRLPPSPKALSLHPRSRPLPTRGPARATTAWPATPG